MRSVEVSGFVPATPPEVDRDLTPTLLVELEGSFRVLETAELSEGTRVIAGAKGLEMALFFEDRSNGYVYYQEGAAGPFAEMETELGYRPENEGVRVTVRSTVSLGVPPRIVFDRIAAWKRRGELNRLLDGLVEEFS